MGPAATRESYRRIIKTTGIMGGSSGINILLRIVRTKFLAVLVGPSGIGLLGMYNSILDMVGATTCLGINSSGVRQTAEAAGTGDDQKIARTFFILRWASFALGILGMMLLMLFSFPICRLTFGSTEYTPEVALLSIVILLDTVMRGEVARIQGMRKIGELAKLNVLGSLFGTVLGIPILYVWGRKGIVPFLLAVSTMNIITAWWYSTKIKSSPVHTGWAAVRSELKPLFRLGSVVMAADLMAIGTVYLLRVLVARNFGLGAVGLYQAAMILSTIYVGFILDAMTKDYYPRLTAVANDCRACNELVNQQVEIGILLSAPPVLAALAFSPLLIQIFYSAKFMPAYDILQWQLLGVLLQVSSWAMGFVLQARGLAKLFFFTELIKNVVYALFIWAGITYVGLIGTGIAFFAMYLFYWIIIYATLKRLITFTWSGANIRIGLLVLLATGLVFTSRFFLKEFSCLLLGGAISLTMGFYSITRLADTAGFNGFSSFFTRVKVRLTS